MTCVLLTVAVVVVLEEWSCFPEGWRSEPISIAECGCEGAVGTRSCSTLCVGLKEEKELSESSSDREGVDVISVDAVEPVLRLLVSLDTLDPMTVPSWLPLAPSSPAST